MPPQVNSQLLFLLASISIHPFTAFALTHSWIFPANEQNAGPYIFESQDTIAASWTDGFVGATLYMFCQTNNIPGWSIGKYNFQAHLALNLISSILTMTNEACYSEFQSPTTVLPNGSYAISLDTVQNNMQCHLDLRVTNASVMREYNSNSGDFLVNVQCVFFRYPPQRVTDLEFVRRGDFFKSIRT